MQKQHYGIRKNQLRTILNTFDPIDFATQSDFTIFNSYSFENDWPNYKKDILNKIGITVGAA